MATKTGAVVEQPTLRAVPEQTMAVREPQDITVVDESVSMFERLARDPNVDVTKIERLIAMQERMLAHKAKAAFDEAFAAMQGEMPVVIEKGRTNNGKYARLEDIQTTVRPILQKHGFAVSFETEWINDAIPSIVGILTHRDGHERRSRFTSSADKTGNKNDVQALGSVVSYGRRYTMLDLLNITTAESDDDGKGTEKRPDPPKGFTDWFHDLEATADNGIAALEAAWGAKGTKEEYRQYVRKYGAEKLAALKEKARKVTP